MGEESIKGEVREPFALTTPPLPNEKPSTNEKLEMIKLTEELHSLKYEYEMTVSKIWS